MHSFKTLIAIKDDHSLTPTEKVVLYTIALHYNSKTGQCNPGQKLIARECGLSRQTVNLIIMGLVKSGKLSAIRTQSSSQYIIRMSEFPTSDVGLPDTKCTKKYPEEKQPQDSTGSEPPKGERGALPQQPQDHLENHQELPMEEKADPPVAGNPYQGPFPRTLREHEYAKAIGEIHEIS